MSRTFVLRSAAAAFAVACLGAPDARADIMLQGDAATAFDVKVLANGLSQPTDMAELPDGRVVITQRLGDVVTVNANGDQVESGHINVYPEFGEQGLLGVVADPDFATNGLLYFYASAEPTTGDPKNKHKVYKIKLGADGMLDTARDTVIANGLRASRQSVDGGASNHNGGGLVIYKGQLYVAVGDTGHNATPPTNHLATCLNATNGKILRVNLDGSIPDDNPLSGESMVTGCTDWDQPLSDQAPEKRVFAWGFRNPYRFWIDEQTGRMWVGDVGETTREEVSVGSPLSDAGGKGEHYGWPFNEGTTMYSKQQESWQPDGTCMGVKPARACIPAAYDYGHTQGNNCVIGGLIPGGCGWAAPWNQRYFFGDYGSGNIWTLDVTPARDGVVSGSVKTFAKSAGIGSFRMGAKGTLYLAEVTGGIVDKLTPKGLDPTMCMTGSGGMGSGGMGAGGTTGGSTSTGGAPAGGRSAAGGTGPSSGGTGTTAGSSGTTAGTSSAMGGTTSTTGGTGTGGTGTGGTGTGGTGTGGTATGGTGTGGSSTGGTAPAAGGTTSAAGKTSSGSSGDDKSGCGCRIDGGETGARSWLAATGLLGLLALRRKRASLRSVRS